MAACLCHVQLCSRLQGDEEEPDRSWGGMRGLPQRGVQACFRARLKAEGSIRVQSHTQMRPRRLPSAVTIDWPYGKVELFPNSEVCSQLCVIYGCLVVGRTR